MITFDNLKLSNVDSIQIVDKNYRIVFNSRFEKGFNPDSVKYNRDDYINKNFFDIYPNISRNQSSIVESMSTGEVTIRKHQKFVDNKGSTFYTNNVTIPLTVQGKIVGVFELTKDITTVDVEDGLEITEEDKPSQRQQQANKITFDSILTRNTYMQENIRRAALLASHSNPIFLYGETGTGKELFAQSIINFCNIPLNKVIIQNCAAVPDNLMESILFKTVKGAYTGAENHKGLF